MTEQDPEATVGDAEGFEERGLSLLVIERSPTQQLRIAYGEFFGSPYLNIRVWWLDEEEGWKPTKRGATVRRAELQDVIQTLQAAAPLMCVDVDPELMQPDATPHEGRDANRDGPGR